MTEPTSKPWEDLGWTEKKYLGWLRSATRRIWSRHPIRTQYIQKHRVRAPLGRNDKLIWASECEMCKTLVKQSEVEVDHIKQGGSFDSWISYIEWSRRILWVTFEDLRVLCKPCHNKVNLSQKLGCSLEEAVFEKQRVDFFKQKVTEQNKQLTKAGASPEELKNKDTRLTAFYKYMKENT